MGNLFSSWNIPQPQKFNPQPANKQTTEMKNMPVQRENSAKYTDFEKRMLDMHNKARQENGLEPLVWDKALQQKAQDWNQFMAQEQGGEAICSKMRHPGTGPDASEEEIDKYLPNGNGQNLYQANAVQKIGSEWTPFDSSSPQEAVRKWYDECNIWKMPKEGQSVPDRFMEVGHMTQLLWKDARKVGCSRIGCRDTNRVHGKDVESKGQIITCHYDKGNVASQFQQQIPSVIKCDKENKWVES